MNFFVNKIHRAREAAFVTLAHGADWRSRARLLSCYYTILRNWADSTETTARLKINGQIFPFCFRRCDIFTLAEILYERQYQLKSALRDRPFIIDAGANIGLSAAWFLAHYPEPTIHCFEPQSANFRLLTSNLGGRKNVHLHQSAVGSHDGPTTLFLADHDAEHSTVAADHGAQTEVVPGTNLSGFILRNNVTQVDLLKLDVEGSEIEVLEGLGNELTRIRVIVGEVHERLVNQSRFYAILKSAGFRVVDRKPSTMNPAAGVHQFEAVRG